MLLTQPKAITSIIFGLFVLGSLAQPKAINPIRFRMCYFEVVLEGIVFWLLTRPKAITPVLFGMYCLGVVNTAQGDYTDPV